MGRRYPYQRFLQINLTALEQLRYDMLRYRLEAWLDRLWRSKRGRAGERAISDCRVIALRRSNRTHLHRPMTCPCFRWHARWFCQAVCEEARGHYVVGIISPCCPRTFAPAERDCDSGRQSRNDRP